MKLQRFAVPGNIEEVSAAGLDAYSAFVSDLFDEAAQVRPRFYNPTATDTPAAASKHDVTWPAFPGIFLAQRLGTEQRWKKADASRTVQDEYCEWSVLRSGGKVKRVTFTTETGLYYDILAGVDPTKLLELYGRATGKNVLLPQLIDANDQYNPTNQFNSSTRGNIVHLMQQNNNLRAAIQLTGDATILRKDAQGRPVTHPQSLVKCGGLGESKRHSDPAIAAAVNNLVAAGNDVTLADPPGLYLHELVTTGMSTPDDADPSDFWTVERGDADHVVRARFEVTEGHDYAVGDIEINGEPIKSGAQLAERVHVRVSVIAKPGVKDTTREPCVN